MKYFCQKQRDRMNLLSVVRITLFCTFIALELSYSFGRAEVCPEDHKSEKSRNWHKSRIFARQVRRVDQDLVPYFDNSTSRNITTTTGKTAYLPCRVRHLGDRTVSWIRRKDLHVLTVGRFTYTSDQRFQSIHMENSDDWTLQIKYPQSKDGGVYECQVSTVPKMSHFVNLNVIESKAKIIGGPTLYINSGSTINLTCLVMESPVPPDYVFWYHNGKVINYDSPRGISVHTEKAQRTTSKLLISNAQPSDSGNYSCVPSNADPAAIGLHVLNGEHPAAMQHGKHTSSGCCLPGSWNTFILLVVNVALFIFNKR
ncbi:lachesin isoform X3 [Parasteatoda tepidariorum]|uniref:lachesin isoform X3 n=1 Tax=Parasteatoda tepidariorum TaxID=114398 RepID=UPI001C7222DC|nr:hemicentin-1 isoform X2 [Parasteatoda tepidariorum]